MDRLAALYQRLGCPKVTDHCDCQPLEQKIDCMGVPSGGAREELTACVVAP
jgi:hypothetical protein